MYDLEEAITERRSTRLFLRDKPVPPALVDEALTLAMRAPSNSNVQPWHLILASGPARDRLVEALLERSSRRIAEGSGVTGGFRTHATRPRRFGLRVDGDCPPRRRGATNRRPAQLGVLPGAAGGSRLHAPRSGLCRRYRRRHVRADAAAGVDGARPGNLCSSVDRGLPRHRARNSWTSARTCESCVVLPSATRTRHSRRMRCGCHGIP